MNGHACTGKHGNQLINGKLTDFALQEGLDSFWRFSKVLSGLVKSPISGLNHGFEVEHQISPNAECLGFLGRKS